MASPSYGNAYRDPKSPLTPIVPITSFDFNTDRIDSKYLSPNPGRTPFNTPKGALKSMLKKSSPTLSPHVYQNLTPSPRKYKSPLPTVPENETSQFKRNPFSPIQQKPIQIIETKPNNKNVLKTHYRECNYYYSSKTTYKNCTVEEKRYFQSISPIKPKKLCERVEILLKSMKMELYGPLFRHEEIDFEVLELLSLNDLTLVGIPEVDAEKILDVTHYWKDFY